MAFYYIIKNHVKFGIRHFVGKEDFNMPSSCCAINCVNRCSKKMLMFRFPTDPERNKLSIGGWQQFDAKDGSLMSIHEFVKNTLLRVRLFTEVSFVCLIILWCLCVEKPSRMEYDIDYVPSIFTHNTKSEASTTHSKLCRYKRLISRRSKAITTKRSSPVKLCF